MGQHLLDVLNDQPILNHFCVLIDAMGSGPSPLGTARALEVKVLGATPAHFNRLGIGMLRKE